MPAPAVQTPHPLGQKPQTTGPHDFSMRNTLSILRKDFQEIDTSRKALRSFGTLIGSIVLAIGFFVIWRNGWSQSATFRWLAGIGSALVLAGLVYPAILRQPYRVWMGLAVVMGFVMTRVILAIVFYLVMTPTGFMLRLFGKDPLQRSWEREAPSYWIDKEYDDDTGARLERYY